MTGRRKRKEEPVPSKLSRMFLNCSDEKYTPGYGVAPIIKYLPEGKIIWCPFDTCHSEFVLHLQEAGFQVKYSHISTGQDFFAYEPDCWDIIVSNPPFSRKMDVFERCLQLDKPFALLMSNFWLNSVGPCRLFKDRELQLLMFDKRIQYDKGEVSHLAAAIIVTVFCLNKSCLRNWRSVGMITAVCIGMWIT